MEEVGIMQDKRIEIVKKLGVFMSLWPAAKITEAQLIMYAELLLEVKLDIIDAAMIKLSKTSTFVPSVAEILKAAEEISNVRNNTSVPTAEEAYFEAMHEARMRSPHDTWKFSHPYVQRAVEIIGKYELCYSPEMASSTNRKDFFRIYDSVVARAREDKVNQDVIRLINSGIVSRLSLPEVKELAEE